MAVRLVSWLLSNTIWEPKVPVLETPAMLLGSLIRSCMTAKTRNSYHVSYNPGTMPSQMQGLGPQPLTLCMTSMEQGTLVPGSV